MKSIVSEVEVGPGIRVSVDTPEHVKVSPLKCFDCEGYKWKPEQIRYLCNHHLNKAQGNKSTILEEAQETTNGRPEDYGQVEDNFRKTADVWTGLLRDKLGNDVSISPTEVACMLAGLKLCRETWKHKRDNLVDGAGYLRCAARLTGEENE